MPRFLSSWCLGAVAVCSMVATGCGLTLDYVPEDGAFPDAQTGLDGGMIATDAAVDGARPDGAVDDGAVDATIPPDDGGAVDAVVCTDEDGDGVSTCEGDCDDTNPTVYPGAPPICGDGVVQDCTGIPGDPADDAVCGGIGTYVSAGRGNDTNPGTQADPVRTIRQGISNAMTIGGGVDVYVAAGNYGEDVTLVEDVSLFGGYEDSGWTRDTAANVSTIRPVTHNGVFAPRGITRVTEVDGFTVLGLSGMGSAASISIQDGSSPVIRDCVVVAPDTTGTSHAIAINLGNIPNDGASPLVAACDIVLGASGTGWTAGRGAWGIQAIQTPLEAIDNRVTLDGAATVQRGIEVNNSTRPARLFGNAVSGSGRAQVVYGIRIASGAARIERNHIEPGNAVDYGVGIAVEGQLTTVVVINNVAFGASGLSATGQSTGFVIGFEGTVTTAPDVLVHSNFFSCGTVTGTATCSGAQIVKEGGTPIVCGRFYDNVMLGGTGGVRAAFAERPLGLADPALFHNNALEVQGTSSGSGLALYLDEGVTPLATEALVNALSIASGNLRTDCGLAGTPGGDFHLATGSLCIDAGDASEAPATDFEGDTRPTGAAPDIGVDETPAP